MGFGMYGRYLSSYPSIHETFNVSLKIYSLRQGETEYSQRGAYCGALDAELTAEGHQMAQAFADAYSSIPWTDV
jgi:broad specificity phosphatase PhoE